MKTKLFIITDNLGTGGAQRQIVEYLKYADRNKFIIKIVNLDIDYDLVGQEIQKLGYEIIGVRHKGFFNIKTVFKLVRLFKKEKPEIIHTYLFTSDCYGRLAAKLSGVPIIVSSVRNLDLWKKFHHIFAAKILAKFTDKFTVNAENVIPFLVNKEGVNPQEIITIYNGVDLTRFSNLREARETKRQLGIPEDAFVVGMVARFAEQKDYKTYFEAAALVIDRIPNVYFLAVGEGSTRNGMENFVRQAGISNNVVFTGLRDDIPDIINCFDIGVLSSHYEGCSNAIMEYMACEKPVIATKVGGNDELVLDELTGYIIEPKNPQILSERIIFLLTNRGLRNQMGKEGKRRIEQEFTVQNLVKKTEDLFEELLQSKNLKVIPKKDSGFKIGYIVSLFPCWSETFILNEIIELQNKGIEISIFSIRKDLEDFIQEKSKQFLDTTYYVNIPKTLISTLLWLIKRPLVMFYLFSTVLKQKYSSNKKLFKNTWCIFVGCFFANIAKQKKLTHIHAHFATYPTLTALVISKLTNIPFTFTAHAHDIFLDKTLLIEKAKEAKAIVTVSNYNKQYISDYCGNGIINKIHTIHCGLDLSEFSPVLAKDNGRINTIVSIGRLTQMKGFDYLIKACNQLKSKIQFNCHIIGDGPLHDNIQELINNLGLSKFVFLEGVLDNNKVKDILNKAVVFVLPCVWDKEDGQDGIPIVLMEAMASGVPVIASNISGIPELVIDNQTGLLVEPKDEKALAEKMIELLANKGLQKSLALKARQHVEKEFDIAKNAIRLGELIFQR